VKIISVARKLSTIEERRKEQYCLFRRGKTVAEVANHKTILGSSLGEDVGFRNNSNNNFFYVIQRYVSNDQAYNKLSGNKD
jgi:hypothetical protein